MAIGDLVLFNGEKHYVVAEALMENIGPSNESVFFLVVALHRIEHAKLEGLLRVKWVELHQLIMLPSEINYQKTEWFMGVYGGQ